MSDNSDKRVVEQVLPAMDTLHDVEPETDEQAELLSEAITSLEALMDDDRDRNGPSPTDKLVSYLNSQDD